MHFLNARKVLNLEVFDIGHFFIRKDMIFRFHILLNDFTANIFPMLMVRGPFVSRLLFEVFQCARNNSN